MKIFIIFAIFEMLGIRRVKFVKTFFWNISSELKIIYKRRKFYELLFIKMQLAGALAWLR